MLCMKAPRVHQIWLKHPGKQGKQLDLFPSPARDSNFYTFLPLLLISVPLLARSRVHSSTRWENKETPCQQTAVYFTTEHKALENKQTNKQKSRQKKRAKDLPFLFPLKVWACLFVSLPQTFSFLLLRLTDIQCYDTHRIKPHRRVIRKTRLVNVTANKQLQFELFEWCLYCRYTHSVSQKCTAQFTSQEQKTHKINTGSQEKSGERSRSAFILSWGWADWREGLVWPRLSVKRVKSLGSTSSNRVVYLFRYMTFMRYSMSKLK